MLTGLEIKRRIEQKQIVIDPFNEAQLNPNSYNLKLADKLLVYSAAPSIRMGESYQRMHGGGIHTYDVPKASRHYDIYREEHNSNSHIEEGIWWDNLDMAKENPTYELTIPPKGLVLVPGKLYLGSTVEYTESPNLIPRLDGRSSIGRLGICIHITAAYGDINFQGCWTLEITVVHPIRIYAGVELCQISYEVPYGEIGSTYNGKYQQSRTAKASQLWKDFKQDE
jgi:dCTP deaminase